MFAREQKQAQQFSSHNPARFGKRTLAQTRKGHSAFLLHRINSNHDAHRLLDTDQETFAAQSNSASSGHNFSQVAVRDPASRAAQTRLSLSEPGDKFEREADALAEQVCGSGTKMNRASPTGANAFESNSKPERQTVQRLPSGSSSSSHPGAGVQGVATSNGQPLDTGTLAFMQSRFGHDFSRVRVHTDGEAAVSAQAVNARAYTQGEHIVFGRGEYEPQTNEGRRVLAHELAHVIQQGGRADVLQRYPKGPGVIPPVMEKRVDKALETMKLSSLNYEVAAANSIEGGAIDVASPDFVDTSQAPPQPISFSTAMTRKGSWERGEIPDMQLKAYLPGTQREMPIKKGMEAFTAQHGDYNGVIYLLADLHPDRLATVMLHETLHLNKPLAIPEGQAGADREHFISEIRSYYYAQYRNVADPQRRFELAVTDAEKDTQYLMNSNISKEDVFLNREQWMKEVGTP